MRTLSAFGQICLVLTGVFAAAAGLAATAPAPDPVTGGIALVLGAFTFGMSYVDGTLSRGQG